jgi:Asp-tRNA(Asn)/Glu-tRNA(Gln) amidotransferase A subunit family amidase
VGWNETFATGGAEPEMVAATRAARDRMESLGARLVPVELPDVDAALVTFLAVFGPEVRAAHARLYPERAADYCPSLRDMLGAFAALDPLAHVEGSIGARAFRHRVDRLFDGIDVLLCPAWPFPATRLRGDERNIEMEGTDGGNPLSVARFTCLWNLAATPAIALPWGAGAQGLPLGVQLVARAGADETLLSIAARLEVEAPARARHPPLA